jgi:hypothetical protein
VKYISLIIILLISIACSSNITEAVVESAVEPVVESDGKHKVLYSDNVLYIDDIEYLPTGNAIKKGNDIIVNGILRPGGHVLASFVDDVFIHSANLMLDKYGLSLTQNNSPSYFIKVSTDDSDRDSKINQLGKIDIVRRLKTTGQGDKFTIIVFFWPNNLKQDCIDVVNELENISIVGVFGFNLSGVINVPLGFEEQWILALKGEPMISGDDLNGYIYLQNN